jgi:DNA adenine methylase
MPDMKISALLPYYGCKRTLAPIIVAQLGPHRCYWEPFCGSCAVLFAKDRATYETVNDLHEDLINLALVVRQEETALQLYDKVTRTLFHENLLPTAKEILVNRFGPKDDPPAMVERAYWYLVFSWMGLNGVSGTLLSGTGTFAVRYSAKGGNGATRWSSVAESIPDWHQRLIGVQILSRDAFTIIPQIDDAEGTALYIDSPYIAKGAKYVHDFKREDHDRLAAELRRFKAARVVISYYDHEALAGLYPGWTKIVCDVAKSMVNSGKRDQRGRTDAPEILLLNGPAFNDDSEQGKLFG